MTKWSSDSCKCVIEYSDTEKVGINPKWIKSFNHCNRHPAQKQGHLTSMLNENQGENGRNVSDAVKAANKKTLYDSS